MGQFFPAIVNYTTLVPFDLKQAVREAGTISPRRGLQVWYGIVEFNVPLDTVGPYRSFRRRQP